MAKFRLYPEKIDIGYKGNIPIRSSAVIPSSRTLSWDGETIPSFAFSAIIDGALYIVNDSEFIASEVGRVGEKMAQAGMVETTRENLRFCAKKWFSVRASEYIAHALSSKDKKLPVLKDQPVLKRPKVLENPEVRFVYAPNLIREVIREDPRVVGDYSFNVSNSLHPVMRNYHELHRENLKRKANSRQNQIFLGDAL